MKTARKKMRTNEEIKSKVLLINDYFKNLIREKSYYDSIYKAMDYSLMAGGKRLRPVLSLSTFEIFSDDFKVILPFAAAIEMIHTYSLIHDDLPCMDNDDLRRGKPTNHKVFGESLALLAGDALLNTAFETMTSFICYEKCDTKRGLAAMKEIANASGVNGMIGGQVIDIESENVKCEIDKLYAMHSLKTGALISASCAIGAILGSGSESDKIKCIEYGENLGLAFQIADDILDVEGDESVLGKPVGSDQANNKATFISHFGVDKCRELVKIYTDKAVSSISAYGTKSSFLTQLAYSLCDRKK